MPEITRDDMISRNCRLRPSSLNEESRTVDASIATETPTEVFDWSRLRIVREVLRMDGADLPNQLPLLDSHQRFSIDNMRGSIRNLRVEGKELIGTLHFAEDTKSNRAWDLVRSGHLTDISIRYQPQKQIDIPAGESRKVGGQEYRADNRPLVITQSWRPNEGSLVAVGADSAAKIRSDSEGVARMNERLRTYLNSIGLRAEATEQDAWQFFAGLVGEQQQRAVSLMFESEPPPADSPATPPADRLVARLAVPAALEVAAPAAPASPPPATWQQGVEAERQRIRDIRELGGNRVPLELIDQAINEGWDTGRSARTFLERLREQQPAGITAIHEHSHETNCTRAALAASCMIRSGVDLNDEHVLRIVYDSERSVGHPVQPFETYRNNLQQAADLGYQFRQMSLLDLAREAVRLDGNRVPMGRDDIIRTAISGGSYSYIFTTNLYAQVMAAYALAPDTTGGWTQEADVPNFLTQEAIFLGRGSALERLPRGEEAKHDALADAHETYKIQRFAKQYVLDDQDIIDDRFDALTSWPQEAGEAAAQLRPELVYSIILSNPTLVRDSVALFHAASHSNLATSSALAEATLETALVAMATQADGGRPLGIFGKFLIIPVALKYDAEKLLKSVELRNTTLDTLYGTYNPLRTEEITIVPEPRLDLGFTDPVTGSAYTGSATTWYLAARGGRYTIRVAFLAGTGRRPTLRSFTLDKGQWGLGWDIKHDIGAAALDYRGLYKATA